MTATTRALWACTLLLSSCVGDGGTDIDTGDDTGTDTGVPPLPDLDALLGPIPAGTAWADLDAPTAQGLFEHAEQLFARYRAQWDETGILAKEAVILPDTGVIRDNVDTYVEHQFPNVVDAATFSVDTLQEPQLGEILRRLYLAHIGSSRNTLAVDDIVELDWDGVTPLLEPPLPEPTALADLQAYTSDGVVAPLESLLAAGTLVEAEAALAQEALYVARSLRAGSIGFYAYGSDDPLTPWGAAVWGAEVTYDYAEQAAFPTREEFLRYQNAAFMSDSHLKYVSEHNVAVVTDLLGPLYATSPAFYDAVLSSDPDAGRMAGLLAGWWSERMVALPEASSSCYPYTDADRDRIVDAFTADLKLPYEATWLADFDTTLDVEGVRLTSLYQQATLDALGLLYDDTELPPGERAAVEAAILAETRFGAVVETTLATLDAVTGSPDASQELRDALAAVPVYGGDPTALDPADVAAVDQVWANVRSALVARYSSGARVHDIDQTLPATVNVSTSGASSTASGGVITVGLGRPQSEAFLYVILTHEALHAFDRRAGLETSGATIEGPASLTEHAVARDILLEFAPPDQGPFYLLDTAGTDARRYGISDATLAVLTTDCSTGQSSVELATAAAEAWGMSGSALGEVPVRSHWGTQFLSYLAGQYVYAEVIAYFEEQIQPGVDNGLDPFDLHTCDLLLPPLTPQIAAQLQTCLGL
jgi:hypothetical protein